MPLSIGQVLNNRYRIDALLGQGGMGAVYRAWDMNLQMPVAVKVNFAASPESLRQFEREAGMLARLSHPNLPRVTDYFFVPGQGQFLVMDFVEGEDLQAMLDRLGALPEAQVLTWVGQVCDALSYLHSQPSPIIHRDIKPANIRIRPDGRAMLVDFGIAKVYDPEMPTTIGARAVTPGYSPPEQYGGGKTDARSDIYALGATLYHLLTGQRPPASIQRMLGDAPMPLPHELNRLVGPATEQVIAKAVEITTSRRFQTIDEFKGALAAKPGVAGRAWAAPARRPRPTPPERRERRPPWVLWVGLAGGLGVVVVVLAIGAVALSRFTGISAPTTTARVLALTPKGTSETAEATATDIPPATDTSSPKPSPTAGPTRTPTSAATATLTETPTPSPMPSPMPSPTPIPPTATPTPEPTLVYQPISLGSYANASSAIDLKSPPTGDVTLGSVPFQLSVDIFKSQASPAPNNGYPTSVLLATDVPRAVRVHLLLTTGNGFNEFNGRVVGRVVAYCDGSAIPVADLQLGRDIREWHGQPNVVSAAPRARQVWSGPMANFPDLTGHIDMLSLDLPGACQTGRLTGLELIDSSATTVNSLDPAFNFTGLTVEHYQ